MKDYSTHRDNLGHLTILLYEGEPDRGGMLITVRDAAQALSLAAEIQAHGELMLEAEKLRVRGAR